MTISDSTEDGFGQPMRYRCMPRAELRHSELSVVAIQPEHIESIRCWRNEQIDVLRQAAPLTPDEQERYYSTHIWPDMDAEHPKNILLAYKVNGKLCGYGGLVHLAWEYSRAEISFLMATSLAGTADDYDYHFPHFLRFMRVLAFDDLGLERLCTETYAIRGRYIDALERSGFDREGTLKNHVRIDGKPTDSLMHGCLKQIKNVRVERQIGRGASVLVTSAATKAPLLRAVLAAARKLHPDIGTIAGDLDERALTAHLADSFWRMPPATDSKIDDLIAGCRQRHIRVILPTRDGELLFWSRHRARFAEEGIAVIVSPAKSVELCLDKVMFAEFGQVRSLPIIPAADHLETVGPGPYVVKERYGAGSLGIGLNLDRDAAVAHSRLLEYPIFQPFIEGSEISIDAWLDRTHRVKGLVLRTRDQVVNGESQVTTTFRDATIEAMTSNALGTLHLYGPVVMQAIIDSNRELHIIECNARFGGASTLGIVAGVDMLYWSLLDAFGADLNEYPFNRAEGEIRQVRVPGDIYVHDPGV